MGSCSAIKSNICICLDSSSTIAINNQNEKSILESQINNQAKDNCSNKCLDKLLLPPLPPKKNTYAYQVSKDMKNFFYNENNNKSQMKQFLLKKTTSEKPIEDNGAIYQDYKLFQILEPYQEEFIKSIISIKDFASEFDDETLTEFAIGFYCIEFDIGKVIYSPNDEAQLFYIIESGSVELKGESDTKILSKGDCFGMDCFEECSLRLEKATVLETTKLLFCSGDFFRKAQNFNTLNALNEKTEAIKKISLFKYLQHHKLMKIAKQMTSLFYKSNSIIINENDIIENIFLIRSGIIRVTRKLKKITKLTQGNYFCHIGMIMKVPCYYTYSIESSEAELYMIPCKLIKELGVKEMIFQFFFNTIQESAIISQIFIQNYDYFFNIFKLKYYEKNDVVFHTDMSKNKKLCIILSGQIKYKAKPETILASSEQIYGDTVIDSRQNLDSDIISEEESLILEAFWEEIVKASENDKNNNIDLCETVQKLKRVPIFAVLKETQFLELAKVVSKETYKDLETISREGEISTKFFIIKSGKVKLYKKSGYVRELEQGGCFGEIPNITGEIKLFTVVSIGVTECYVLNREDFGLFENTLNKQIKQLSGLNDVSVTLPDLFFVKTLGNGKFGKVYLVHNQKHFYAIKFAKIKNICMNKNLMQYYYNEKRILLQIDHPFILKLVKTLKNSEYLFFLFEYIDGITLKTYIDKRKKGSTKNQFETAFYGGILLTVINYLHNRKIIHRDIKPDNCMLDKNGYLKLIDFGVAKELKDKDTTTTICGTPHYLAPEIILGKGYSFSSDYWSLGVTLFEIFYGYVPFGQSSKDVTDIYYEIINKKLPLPYDPKFNDINSFFKIILSKNLLHRVCNFFLLKSHPFFHIFDFDQLLEFNIKSPFQPDSYIDSNANNSVSMISVCNVSIRQYMESHQNYEDNTISYEEEYLKEKKFIDDF